MEVGVVVVEEDVVELLWWKLRACISILERSRLAVLVVWRSHP